MPVEAGWSSVFSLPGVPFGVGLLPPLGQNGLLIVANSLKLTVRMFRARVGRFFWTHHVLKVHTDTHTRGKTPEPAVTIKFFPSCTL